MIGVICDQAGRYSMFAQCLTSLRAPVNTQIQYAIGSDRSVGRNTLVRQAFEIGAEWLLFLDDDHTFPPSILMRLLEHEQPVVGALYCQRQPPFVPIAYSAKEEQEGPLPARYTPLDLTEIPGEGLLPVRAVGTGGMLIRMEVFHEMREAYGADYTDGRYPWFQHTTEQSEDLRFCDQCDSLAIPMFVDLEVRLGHLAPSAVWPVFDPDLDAWTIGMSLADQFTVAFPVVKATE